LNRLQFFFNTNQEDYVVHWIGHGQENTGDWGVSGGVIKFEDVYNIWVTACSNNLSVRKRLLIISDCCYSGEWVIQLKLKERQCREQKVPHPEIAIQSSTTWNSIGATHTFSNAWTQQHSFNPLESLCIHLAEFKQKNQLSKDIPKLNNSEYVTLDEIVQWDISELNRIYRNTTGNWSTTVPYGLSIPLCCSLWNPLFPSPQPTYQVYIGAVIILNFPDGFDPRRPLMIDPKILY
jgi:hypothetical protein